MVLKGLGQSGGCPQSRQCLGKLYPSTIQYEYSSTSNLAAVQPKVADDKAKQPGSLNFNLDCMTCRCPGSLQIFVNDLQAYQGKSRRMRIKHRAFGSMD